MSTSAALLLLLQVILAEKIKMENVIVTSVRLGMLARRMVVVHAVPCCCRVCFCSFGINLAMMFT